MNLNSVLIGSEEPKRLTDYYSALFGEPARQDGGYVAWRVGSGSIIVGPHDQVKGRSVHPGRVIWNIETADVEGHFARLRDAGATVVSEPKSPNGETWIATFSDPDDNYFQLVSPVGG